MASHRVLVYGGKGALGSQLVQHFKSKGWWVGSIDMALNEEASDNVLVKRSECFMEQADQVTADVAQLLGQQKVDAILCVAGGWAGGKCSSKDLVKNSDLMWKQSVWTSTISSQLAALHLKTGGLLALTGAKACLTGTPGMVGYGMAKAAVHQLCRSLGEKNSGLPADAIAVAILPVTLDTPMNRKFMPDADFGTWTPLEYVSEMFFGWASGVDRPVTGSLAVYAEGGGEKVGVERGKRRQNKWGVRGRLEKESFSPPSADLPGRTQRSNLWFCRTCTWSDDLSRSNLVPAGHCTWSVSAVIWFPADQASVDLVSVDLVSVDLVSVDQAPVDLVSVDLVSVYQVSVDLVSVDLVSVDQ
ncbi:unnamed protein product, partial [Gadus morhua 'NCC']